MFGQEYENDDYNPNEDEDFEPEPNYDSLNAERALVEWEASRPVAAPCDSGEIEPF
jgi:hypothetical protein